MDQLIDALLSLDPVGPGALVFGAFMAALLGAIILLGFVLVQAPEAGRRGGTEGANSTGFDLDLVALWRLKRSLGKNPTPEPSCDPPVHPERSER